MPCELVPGDEFAGHRIERVIGRGGMSVVHLAEDIELGRKDALKVLTGHLADEQSFRDRFMHERKALASLEHPNIVPVYRAGEEGGCLYLVMQLINGSDLGSVLNEGPIEPARAIAIVSQVAAALDYAHDVKGMVHRDVKPANILLAHPGTPMEHAYLVDFGIAKGLNTQRGLTGTGQTVGTPDYMAPEQIRNLDVDGRTDQYALGCVLFHCANGEPPFPRVDAYATMFAQINDVPPAIDLPGADDVTRRALAKEKDDRYPTCTAFAEAARAQVEAADETRVLTAPYEIPPERQQRDRGWWVASAVAAVFVAAIVISLVALSGDGDPGPDPPGPSSPETTSPSVSQGVGGGQVRMAILWNRHIWSEVEDPPRPEAGQVVFTSATLAGDDGIVAAGHADEEDGSENAAVWTRRGDVNWAPREVPGGEDPVSNERIWDVAASGDLVVAVGYDDGAPAAWYSMNRGRSWHQSEVPEDEGSMNAVIVRPSGFSAFGRDTEAGDVGAVWRTEDGITWERLEDPGFAAAGAWMSDVHNAGDTAAAVGRSGPVGETDAAIWESSGSSWNRVNPARFAEAGEQYLLDVTELDGTIVAVGLDEGNAMIWTKGEEGWIRPDVPRREDAALWAVAAVDDHYFVAAGWAVSDEGGYDAAVWFSRDGVTWRRQLPTSDAAVDLAGPRYEEIRALLTDDAAGRVFAFGGEAANAAHEDSNAQVWVGRVL